MPEATYRKMAPGEYQAYEALYKALNDASLNAVDGGTSNLLGNAAQKISNIITDENINHLDASTALFAAFASKMDPVNKTLADIKAQVGAIDERIGAAGSLITALAKVASYIK